MITEFQIKSNCAHTCCECEDHKTFLAVADLSLRPRPPSTSSYFGNEAYIVSVVSHQIRALSSLGSMYEIYLLFLKIGRVLRMYV